MRAEVPRDSAGLKDTVEIGRSREHDGGDDGYVAETGWCREQIRLGSCSAANQTGGSAYWRAARARASSGSGLSVGIFLTASTRCLRAGSPRCPKFIKAGSHLEEPGTLSASQLAGSDYARRAWTWVGVRRACARSNSAS